MTNTSKPAPYLAIAASVALALVAIPYATHAVRASATVPLTRDAAAASWKPIALPDPDALRPPAPPAAWSPTFQADLWGASRARASLTPERAEAMKAWTSRPAPLPWIELLRENLTFHRHKNYPPRTARAYAITCVAMYDAMLVAQRARATYGRPAPAQVAPWLVGPVVPSDGEPTYPSVRAAAAFAGATAIGYLVPEAREAAIARATEAADAQLWAGLAYPSDVAAGRAIGVAVAERLIADRKGDGADQYSPIPAEAHIPLPKERHGGLWDHPTPHEPLAGTWRPWLLPRPDAHRLPEPPRPGSPRFEKELQEVLDADHALTPFQMAAADRWAKASPSNDWNRIAVGAVERHGLSDLAAARVMAYWSTAQADAAIACWDTKYHWFQIRPVAADHRKRPKSTWRPYLVSTPAHPSYPSGHCAFSGASAGFLESVFPDEKKSYDVVMQEVSMSRLWGGIHYRADLMDGQQLGRAVAAHHLAAYKAELPPTP